MHIICLQDTAGGFITTTADVNDQLDIGNRVLLEKVHTFCNLGDVLTAEGGRDSAVTARVRCAWKNVSRVLTYLN